MNASESARHRIRRARPADAEGLAEIFNEGVRDRVATFETRSASPEDALRWIDEELVLVAEGPDFGRELVGWAKAGPYSDAHHYYAGVREATLYVARAARRSGVGSALLSALADEAGADGAHKLVGKIFTSNAPSIALVEGLGWRRVGVHERHGTLDGEWKDVLVVEWLLGGRD